MDALARMGQFVVSDEASVVLACVGLGSCIGLALVDRRAGVAGLAHVMLPEAPSEEVASAAPAKYGDTAVPALFEAVLAAGGARHRLEAVLVGGAQMFKLKGAEIGARNEAAVREALVRLRIPVQAAATGGSTGRTVKVEVGAGVVIARPAAGSDEVLLGNARVAA